jgi:hypothetical protein
MTPKRYFVLKVKGKAKIPDYIQVRDEHFTLIGYFRPGHTTQKTGRLADPNQRLFQLVENLASGLPYGVVSELSIALD